MACLVLAHFIDIVKVSQFSSTAFIFPCTQQSSSFIAFIERTEMGRRSLPADQAIF